METFSKYLKLKPWKFKLHCNGPSECKNTCIFQNLIQNWVSQKKIDSTMPEKKIWGGSEHNLNHYYDF